MIRLARLRGAFTALALALGLLAGGAQAQDAAALTAFQQRDARLFTVGWRLATANAPFCAETVRSAGLLLHDAQAYGRPEAVRAAFTLAGDIAVQAVAPDSPADKAGLRPNDTLLAIDGAPVAVQFPLGKKGWQRPAAIADALDAALAKGPVELSWSRPDAGIMHASVAGVAACAGRFEVLDSSNGASADGQRVLIGYRFPAFAYAEDAFAAAIAHEMAHNLLGHLRTFETTGRKQHLVRISERDADRIMPWLIANGGYDPQAAVRFMQEWGPKYGGGLLRARTHDGWDERVEFIEPEVALVRAAIARDGRADWSREFRQDLPAALAE